jgi:hypothetical protein
MSPLRPWEWANLAGDDARRWLLACAVRNAYEDGMGDARASKQGFDRLSTKEVGEVG